MSNYPSTQALVSRLVNAYWRLLPPPGQEPDYYGRKYPGRLIPRPEGNRHRGTVTGEALLAFQAAPDNYALPPEHAVFAPDLRPLSKLVSEAVTAIFEGDDKPWLRAAVLRLLESPVFFWWLNAEQRPGLFSVYGVFAPQPADRLIDLELALETPDREPTAMEKHRHLFRRAVREVKRLESIDVSGELIRRQLAPLGELLASLGHGSLARRCDDSTLFSATPAIVFLTECIRALDGPQVSPTPCNETPPPRTEKERRKPDKKKPMLRAEANQEAMRLAKREGKTFFLLSARKQALLIGCSFATWKGTEFYAKAQLRRRNEADRIAKGPRPGAPPVVGFGRELEAVTGEGERDEVLCRLADAEKSAGQTPQEKPLTEEVRRLIAEQLDNYEASPLEDDPPSGKPRKNRHKKRL